MMMMVIEYNGHRRAENKTIKKKEGEENNSLTIWAGFIVLPKLISAITDHKHHF